MMSYPFSFPNCWKPKQDSWYYKAVKIVQSAETIESDSQSSWTEACCPITPHFIETNWKHCPHLLHFLSYFWNSRSSGILCIL